MMRKFITFIIAAVMVCGLSAQALAYEYNPEGFDFSKPINESFNNAAYVKDWVKALGGGGQVYADVYILGGSSDQLINFGTGTNAKHFSGLFSNSEFSNGWTFNGDPVGTNQNVKDLSFELIVKNGTHFFKLNSDNNANGNNPAAKEIKFWELTADFTYNGWILPAGTILFGVGDASKNPQTYTDMFGVFQLGKLNPTPIPAAAWLLGSGLAGMLGLRKRLGRG